MTSSQRLAQITSHVASKAPLRVAVIGSGNWGNALAKIVAENTSSPSQSIFAKQVKMWMYEETIQHEGRDQKLSDVFNRTHENVKYLKGIKCPTNILAVPDIKEVARTSDILIIVVPHQFVDSICKQMQGHVLPSALALSCIKGVSVSKKGISLFSSILQERLGIYCGALSGANIASEIAQEKFSETTIAFNPTDQTAPLRDPRVTSEVMKQLFHRPYFRVGTIDDIAGVSLAGALKNIVAVAAGFGDGLGYGDNTKAAIMRIGLVEMLRFGKMFFGDNVRTATFTEHSCGVADLITSCAGGRNRLCAMEFAKTGKSMDQLEQELLSGQKLQGAATAKEVNELLVERNLVHKFPLFTAVFKIVYEGVPPSKMWEMLAEEEEK